MKGNKYLPYIIFGIPAAIAVYMIVKSLSGKKGIDAPPLTPQEDGNVDTSGGGARPSITKYFPLRKGSKGAKVKELQNAILSFDKTLLPKFGADGDFGSETESAVIKLLKKNSVDSQQEIDNILTLKSRIAQTVAEQEKVRLANANRTKLAKTLVDYFNQSPVLRNFYSLQNVSVFKYKVTSDGREIADGSIKLTVGQKIPLSKNTTFKIDSMGFIAAFDNGTKYSFSPYSFEVK